MGENRKDSGRVGRAVGAVLAVGVLGWTSWLAWQAQGLPSDEELAGRWDEVVALASSRDEAERPRLHHIDDVKAVVRADDTDRAEVARMLREGTHFPERGSVSLSVVAHWALRDDNVDAALVDGVLRLAADYRAEGGTGRFLSGCSITLDALRTAVDRGLPVAADVDALLPTREGWVAAFCREAVAWDAMPTHRLIAATAHRGVQRPLGLLTSTPFHQRLAERSVRMLWVERLEDVRAGRPLEYDGEPNGTVAALRGLFGDVEFLDSHPFRELGALSSGLEWQLAEIDRAYAEIRARG